MAHSTTKLVCCFFDVVDDGQSFDSFINRLKIDFDVKMLKFVRIILPTKYLLYKNNSHALSVSGAMH